jgi:nitroreductase/NAD-dependent dihydropyrimidine dehydrogenase PreA subunit
MTAIIVDKALCTRCDICGTTCVMGIIEKATDSSIPVVRKDREAKCIRCGHCESFCPQQALTLDFLADEKLRIEPQDGLIAPRDLSLYMKKRRSIRHFTAQPVPKERIAEVIDVARYAASGGNSQPVEWLVIHDPSEVKRIASLTIDWMRTIRDTSHPFAPYASALVSEWDSGADPICRDAPHLLFTHLPRRGQNDDPTDAIIAMTYFDVAAPSFGIGTCWAGFVKLAVDAYKPMQDALALPEGRKAAHAMMFGYPRYAITSIPRRNPASVTWR